MTSEIKLNKQATAPIKRRKVASLDKRKARAGWLFVLPFIIGFLLVYLPIIKDSIWFTLCDVKTIAGASYETTFVGFKHYSDAFQDTDFTTTLVSGLKQLVLDIPAIVIFALFMAVMLNQKMFGRAVFRAIFFVPVIISTGLISDLDANNLMQNYQNSSGGIDTGTGSSAVTEIVSATDLTALFQNMAIGTDLATYVIGLINSIYNIINRSGVQMLIFLAGLQSISGAIYESCSIDGASAWETFWKITFPMISPMILVNTIYTVIDSFTDSGNTVMQYISNVYTKPGQSVLSSAMSWIYFAIILVAIGIVAAIMSAVVFYQRRD